MGKALIIGAGGVSNVVVHKCCQNPDIFEEICIASRTKSKCDAIKSSLKSVTTKVSTAEVNADNTHELVDLISAFRPDIVINVALPYQDLTIMDACLITGVHYLDTANYEPPDIPKFEYKWQWAYKERFEKAGLTAILGSGFDPGVTGVFCAYGLKHHFDEIHQIDIIDANAGDHGHHFATNFNPEINIREITANGKYWEAGKWIKTSPLSMRNIYNLPQIGPKDIYMLYHEELESLALNITGIEKIRFWMTFSHKYLTYLNVLQNVGMTSIKPITFRGIEIQPLHFLKAVLPDPASLGPRTKGKTNIGCLMQGVKNGKSKSYYIYNVCVHEDTYAEVGSQAISYTTGVPAMIGAKLLLEGKWKIPGVYNVEEFDPDPFMDELKKQGLPWHEDFNPALID